MNKLLTIAASAILVASSAFAWEPEEMNAVIDQTNFIVNKGCSGTLISLDPALILTNHHCVSNNIRTVSREVPDDNGKIATVKELKLDPVVVEQVAYNGHETVGSSTYVAEIAAYEKTRDLAILRLRAVSVPYTIFSPILPEGESVKRGQPVWAVGNPAGFDATVTSGIISSTTRTFQFPWAENEDLPMIQTDVGIFGGNSGGALYDMQGRLVGVPAAGHRQATHLGLAIPTSIVWEVLSKNCLAEHVGGMNDETCNKEETTEEDK